jgi:hypothetical protein
MRKRRKALLWTLAGLLVVFAAVLLTTHRQPADYGPVYNGLTLAQWLDVVNRHRVNGYFATFQEGRPPSRNATAQEIDDAEEAVRAIGTNALPSLLAWIRWKPGTTKRLYLGAVMRIGLPGRIESRAVLAAGRWHEDLAEMAFDGLRILHTNPVAFETLSKLATDTNHPNVHATRAFTAVTNPPGL